MRKIAKNNEKRNSEMGIAADVVKEESADGLTYFTLYSYYSTTHVSILLKPSS